MCSSSSSLSPPSSSRPPMATFASLKALHTLIGDALDDVERIFVSDRVLNRAPLDFPSPDKPYDSLSPAEALLFHPTVAHAAKLIVSATGQLAAAIQPPFLTINDAAAGVSGHICLRHL